MQNEDEKVQTTMRLDRATWLRLRQMAEARALRDGGRPSMAAAVEGLVNRAVITDPRAGR